MNREKQGPCGQSGAAHVCSPPKTRNFSLFRKCVFLQRTLQAKLEVLRRVGITHAQREHKRVAVLELRCANAMLKDTLCSRTSLETPSFQLPELFTHLQKLDRRPPGSYNSQGHDVAPAERQGQAHRVARARRGSRSRAQRTPWHHPSPEHRNQGQLDKCPPETAPAKGGRFIATPEHSTNSTLCENQQGVKNPSQSSFSSRLEPSARHVRTVRMVPGVASFTSLPNDRNGGRKTTKHIKGKQATPTPTLKALRWHLPCTYNLSHPFLGVG